MRIFAALKTDSIKRPLREYTNILLTFLMTELKNTPIEDFDWDAYENGETACLSHGEIHVRLDGGSETGIR